MRGAKISSRYERRVLKNLHDLSGGAKKIHDLDGGAKILHDLKKLQGSRV